VGGHMTLGYAYAHVYSSVLLSFSPSHPYGVLRIRVLLYILCPHDPLFNISFLKFSILYFDFPKDIYLFFNYIRLVNLEAILSSLVDFWEFPSKEEE
jgi:hypothetical protein